MTGVRSQESEDWIQESELSRPTTQARTPHAPAGQTPPARRRVLKFLLQVECAPETNVDAIELPRALEGIRMWTQAICAAITTGPKPRVTVKEEA